MGRILIVDPSVLDRKRMRGILEAAGHTVVEIPSCSEAMAALQGAQVGEVSLLLTELTLPDGDGAAFLRWLKQQEQMQEVPVLVVTQPLDRDRLIEVVQAGAATVVAKPFGPDLLLRRVTRALAERAESCFGVDRWLQWEFADYLRKELKRAYRNATQFSVVVARLRPGADGRGLPPLMGLLSSTLRETDVLVRMGENQVLLLLPDTDARGAQVVVTRVREALGAMQQADSAQFELQLFTGSATFPTEAGDVESLVTLAQERAV